MLENHTNLATSFGQLSSDSVVSSRPSTSTLPLGWALQQVYTTYKRTLTRA